MPKSKPRGKSTAKPQPRQSTAARTTNRPQQSTQKKTFSSAPKQQPQKQNPSGAMSPPLPFRFMKGLVHIYNIVPNKDTKNGPRHFVYYVDSVSQEKFKWTTGDPAYIEVLEQLPIFIDKKPGDYNVNWSGTKANNDVSLEIELASQ